MCQVSHVMCHMSCVICHVSHVMCHTSCGMLHVPCVPCHADMQFVTNFTRIGFWVVNFTPQNTVIYDPFHLKNDVILNKKNGFYSDSTLNSFNLQNKPPCLHPFTSTAPKQMTKNIKKATGSEFTINSICSWEKSTPLKRNLTWIIFLHP